MRLSYGLLWCLAHTSVLLAQRSGKDRPSPETAAIAALRRATVTVVAVLPDGSATGSGFILTSQGLIATAAHVLRGAKSASVKLQSGETFDVQGIAAIDDARDFALIRIAGYGLPTVALGNSEDVEVGRRLLAVGAPLGLDATVSDGLLSGERLVDGTKVYQISIPVSPGSSGGPVATEEGKVVAMVVRGVEVEGAENLNFALPINYLRGQAALAADKTPIPLVQLSHPRTASPTPSLLTEEPGAQLRSIDSGTATLPAVVNESLDVEWRALEGVQVATEAKPENGMRVTTASDFALGRTPTGAQTIENHVTNVWWQSADSWLSDKGGAWYRDELRTVVHLGHPSGADVFFQRTAVSGRAEGRGFELRVAGDTMVLDSAWNQHTGHVPDGVLPISALDMAVAALPNSLPSSFYVWVLEKNGWPAKPVWARVDFSRRRTMDIPLAKPGTDCAGTDFHTKSLSMEVLDATATVGARTVTSVVLAQRPHVNVMNAKCVRLAEGDPGK